MRDAAGGVLTGADAVVPVPLHWMRRRQRGFNQAALLAARLGLPVCHALRRTRRTRPQVELPAGERRTNVDRAFALAWRYRWRMVRPNRGFRTRPLEGLTVVLVDDVSTTGATLGACARVLVAAGVREVRVLTVARVASRSSA
jgi:ComF family protein